MQLEQPVGAGEPREREVVRQGSLVQAFGECHVKVHDNPVKGIHVKPGRRGHPTPSIASVAADTVSGSRVTARSSRCSHVGRCT